jgi:hypothetical protein
LSAALAALWPPTGPASRAAPAVAIARLELGLLGVHVAIGDPLNPAAELHGRGYQRMPTGELAHPGTDPAIWSNPLPILWPQAGESWGIAQVMAVFDRDDAQSTVLATAAVPQPYVVRGGDQPRIPPWGLLIGGVDAGTPRMFGMGRFGESLYGGYPPEGGVFFTATLIGFAWLRDTASCAPYQPAPPLIVGGCT